jgi:hypothetical protein
MEKKRSLRTPLFLCKIGDADEIEVEAEIDVESGWRRRWNPDDSVPETSN